MKWNTVLFDLDGTLTDPAEGITRCVAYALEHFGITVTDRSALQRFIGPPLVDSFCNDCGMTEEQAKEAIACYRERFSAVGWQENVPYEGIYDLLGHLQEAGIKLILATSKPEEYARRIMEHFALAPYFSVICGAPMHAPRGHGKADVICDALGRGAVTDLAHTVMVGDRRYDVEGAHEAGISCIGVLYGYGNKQELKEAGAEHIVSDPFELEALLQS